MAENKGKKTKSFCFRIDTELLNKLHYVSEYDGRSMSSEVLHLMKKYVKAYEDKYGPIELEADNQKKI